MWRLLGLLAGLALLPLALVALLLAALQSPAVRGLAEGAVNRFIPNVTVGGLDAGLPSRLALGYVALADDQGVWFEGEDVRVVWRPAALLEGLVHVEQVAADHLRVRRAPVATDTGEPPPAPTAEADTAPGVPASLFPLRVDRLHVGTIQLDEPLLGEAASFTLAGTIDAATGTRVDTSLKLERTDQAGLMLALDADADLAAQTLALGLRLDEASGLLARLAGEPRLEPLALRLEGEGPFTTWTGALRLDAGTVAALDTDIGLAFPAPLALRLDGSVMAGADLQATPMAPLLDAPVSFALEATQAAGATIVDRLAVDAAWLALDGTARLEAGRLRADLTLDAPDLTALEPLAGTPLAGALTLAAQLDGPLPVPPGTVLLDGRAIRAGPLDVGRIEQRIEVETLSDGAIGFGLDGLVAALGIETGAARLDDDLAIRARGSLVPGGPFRLDSATVDGDLMALSATADGDLANGSVEAEARLDLPRLDAFKVVSPAAPEGGLELEVTAALADGFGRGEVSLTAAGRALAGLPAPGGALLGTAPTLDVALRLQPLPALVLDRVALRGEQLRLEAMGEASLDSLSGRLDARLEVPALAPVGEALDQPLDGSLALNLEVDGGLDGFEAEARLAAADLVAAGQAFDEALTTVTAAGSLDAVTGALDARLARAGEAVVLAAAYGFTTDALALESLALTAPGARLAGDLRLALASLGIAGSVEGEASDLARLGGWLGLPMRGSVALDVALDDTDGQAATVSASVDGLEAFGLAVDAVDIEASGRDLMGAVALDAEVSVRGVVQGQTRVDSARLGVAGDLGRLTVDLEADGGLPDPFRVEGAGLVQREGTATRTTLERLEGEIAEVPVRLSNPATVRLDDGTVELDGLELEIDTARLRTRASLTPERVDGSLVLERFDLTRLEAFGGPALEGTVESAWTLAGTPAAPVVDGEVRIAGLRPPDSDGEAAAIDAGIALGGGSLDAVVTTEGLGDPGLRAEATLPVRFAIEPFAFALPAPLPLDARLAGTVDLARLAAWYGLDGQDVRGELTADVTAAGTADEPVLDGRIETADARFVDAVAGILVDDLDLTLRATQNRIEVAALRAVDGREGTLAGSGSVTFGGDGTAFAIEAALDRFAVVQREDLFIEMSGETQITGGDPDIDVFGRFTVDRGEIFLPDGSGAQGFATLDVTTAEDLAVVEETDAPNPAAGIVNLDVAVELPGRLFVRGRGLLSDWGGSVAVTGDATAPSITGLIEYRRGYVDVLQNRFDFRKGEIRFTGDFPPEPFVDVEATVPAGDYTAILQVRGAAMDPDITVSSEPALPEDEVLSRLLFDQDRQELNTFQALRLAAALQELRGGRGLGDRLRAGLGLDTLDIGGETADTANLRGGTYVSEDVFVEVQQGLKPDSGAARVEVELTPRIKVETRVNQDQTSSVGLRWRFDY